MWGKEEHLPLKTQSRSRLLESAGSKRASSPPHGLDKAQTEGRRWVGLCKRRLGELCRIILLWFQNEETQLSQGTLERAGRGIYHARHWLGALRTISVLISQQSYNYVLLAHLMMKKKTKPTDLRNSSKLTKVVSDRAEPPHSFGLI